jgi:hypothetical protein
MTVAVTVTTAHTALLAALCVPDAASEIARMPRPETEIDWPTLKSVVSAGVVAEASVKVPPAGLIAATDNVLYFISTVICAAPAPVTPRFSCPERSLPFESEYCTCDMASLDTSGDCHRTGR